MPHYNLAFDDGEGDSGIKISTYVCPVDGSCIPFETAREANSNVCDILDKEGTEANIKNSSCTQDFH